MSVVGPINNRSQDGEEHVMYPSVHTQRLVGSYYRIVLCSEYPATPESNLGVKTGSKTNRKKNQTLSKTLKLVEKVPCVIKLLKQLLLEETSIVMTLADYAKLSFAFLNNSSVSTLENTKVRDVVIVKHDSTAATRKPQQMPECATVQARTGQSWCRRF